MDILQENNIINIVTTTASTASAASTLALFSLSTQSSSIPSSPSPPSSPSSFSHEYDTTNYFSRLPNETVFTIFAFVITNQNTVKTTSPTRVYSPHKQLSILSQVNRLFYKITNDVLLWQISFETRFDYEAIIRAGIIDNNLIGDSVNFFNAAEGEGEGESISSKVQNSSSFVQNDRNIWKELYKERQIALNKIKNYVKHVKPTLPSPFVSDDGETDDFSTTVHLDDFMELNFDDESENNNDSDINTNNVDSSTLDSTDQVDDIVDYQLFEFDVDFNFTGNDGARTEEMERDNLVYTFEDGEEFQELTLENNMTTTGDSVKEDDIKEDIIKEDTTKEDTMKENTVKEDTVKEDTVKEGTIKEDTVNEDIVNEDILKEDTKVEELLRENVTEFESNFGIDNTSVINVNSVSQDIDFVSEDLIKFDDPELDSIFASDAIESDNFIDTQTPNVDINTYNEVLAKDTNNSAKEVDHVAQAQDFSNPEINDDLNITLQDYDESSKLLDDESLKLPDDEESSSKLHEGIPQLQDYEESSTKFQKSEEISSSKPPDNVYIELIGDDLPDYDENEEVSQSRDYEDNQKLTNLKDYNEIEGLSQLQDFNGNEASINLQDFSDNQVESSSKEIINEIDLPDYEEDDDVEITNLPNYEIKTNLQSENIVIENHDYDLPDYVDEEADLFNENIPEINNENSIENNIEQQNGLPSRDAIIESENDESPDYETNDESNLSNHDENDDIMVQQNEIEEMDDIFNSDEEDNETFEIVNNNIQLYISENIQNRMRTRRKIIQQNNDPELLKILNIIWKICQENDGMNSEVLLGANVKELAVSLIKSLDKMEAQIEYLSIALQILSILISWHPELTIDLHKSKSFWMTIRYAMINVDMFFPELEVNTGNKQLVLPSSAGSAIHIFFHTNFFNLSNPNEFFDEYVPPPQLIPDSNVFNNVYNKSELEKSIIQPFGEDLSGKWCGYYLYHAYTPSLQIRESVMDIKSLIFSPSKPGKVYYLNHIGNNPVPVTDKIVKEISGSGSDKHGEFVIRHGIITEKGNVNFVKTYIGRHSLIYDGILLPVGICGRWGYPEQRQQRQQWQQWRGNFWIWKK